MADRLKQGIEYELTATDKTAAGTESALARLVEAEKKTKDAQKKAQDEAKQTQGVFQAITQALHGNFEALGKMLVQTIAKLNGVKLSGLALGAVGLAVSAVVAVGKSLVDVFKSAREQISEIQTENIEASFKSINEESKLFSDNMARARQEAADQKKVFEDNVQLIRDMAKAQNEYAKQQALAVASSDSERQDIERRFAGTNDQNDAYLDQKLRDEAIRNAKDELGRLQEELDRAVDDRETYRSMAKRHTSAMRSNSRNTGVWQGIMDYIGVGDTSGDIEGSAKTAERYRELEQEAIKKAADLEMKIEAARHALEVANKRDEIAAVQDEADAQKRFNEEVAAENERIQKDNMEAERMLREEAEENAKQIEEMRIRTEKEVLAQRKAAIAEASGLEKQAVEQNAQAQARLSAARANVARAWGWYRDRDSLSAQLKEEKENAEAERQFERDFDKLSFRRDWRTAKNLTVDQEAVRRVALAKEEERAAEKWAQQTAEATQASAESLKKIESELAGEE